LEAKYIKLAKEVEEKEKRVKESKKQLHSSESDWEIEKR
jgi:hypothetical protein